MRPGLTALFACGVLLYANVAAPCSVRGPLPTAIELIARADVIVVAVARELVPGEKAPTPAPAQQVNPLLPPLPLSPFHPPPPPPPPFPNGDPTYSDRIRFEIIETLKGEAVTPLLIRGQWATQDDFNDSRVPFNTVRHGGDSECFAYSYRQHAAYLLLLQKTARGDLSPYWDPLSRVNDQIRPGRDEWLEWVRARTSERATPR